MIDIRVCAGKGYNVLVGSGLMESIGRRAKSIFPGAAKAAVISDTTVAGLYYDKVKAGLEDAGFEVIPFQVTPGENSKSGAVYLELLENLSLARLTRTDFIIALGGGVVGDLAGFVAASYLRGTEFIQIPTTLLAMVDSSVGGKTGIDLPSGKNLAGAFHQPALVLCDTDALNTLPDDVFGDGVAEVIKCGMIRSPNLLSLLGGDWIRADLAGIIAECVGIKRDVVERDELDFGERMLLNFGHMIGHAIEKLSGYKIPHGQAVAIGMTVETRSALRQNLCPPDCLDTLNRLLEKHNLPTATDYLPGDIYNAALGDKKRAGGGITLITPRTLGSCELRKIPLDKLCEWIELGVNQ